MQIKISIHVKSWELFAEEINTDDFFFSFGRLPKEFHI